MKLVKIASASVKKCKHKNHTVLKCADKTATELVNDKISINHPNDVTHASRVSTHKKIKKLVLEEDDISKSLASVSAIISKGLHAKHVLFDYLEEALINANKRWRHLSRCENSENA